MKYFLKSPLVIHNNDGVRVLNRPIQDDISRLDNLVELVVFTPRGSFVADPDFGFEYWNYEYVNVHFREFNNDQDVTQQACKDSIRNSLYMYEPNLKHVEVSIQLAALTDSEQAKRKTWSKYEVIVHVKGELDNGLGTLRTYSKTIRFLMEPTAKKMTI